MTILYDKDRDYAEVILQKTANYAEDLNNIITVFKSEKNDKIVGYGFEKASHTVFEFKDLSLQAKLAVLLKMARSHQGITQEEAAERIHNITLRHYQRLESGEENTSLSMIESVMKAFPKVDFSRLLKKVV